MLDFLAVGDVMLDVRLPAGPGRHGPIASLAAGSAVNAALAAGRLGARAGVAGAVGDDSVGRVIELDLEASGIELHLTRVEGATTGTAVYGERVVADRGANAVYMPASLPEARITLVSGYLPEAARTRALELASGILAVDLQGVVHDAPGADVVLGPGLDLGAVAAPLVVSTLGAEGAVAIHGEERASARPRRLLEETPVGAGDAFAAGFLLALASGEPLAAALQAGCDAVAP
jgi:ribokinase